MNKKSIYKVLEDISEKGCQCNFGNLHFEDCSTRVAKDALAELKNLGDAFTKTMLANAEVGKLNVDLHEQVGELRDALQWAWDNMKFTSYPGDDWEYEFCDVCGAPEWKHREGCKAEEQKRIAQRLLVDAKVRNDSTAAATSGEDG